MHTIAAKAVCFGEALKPEFKEYQEQIVKNAKVLSEELLKLGFNLVSGGTDNHLILIDLRNKNITGKEPNNLKDLQEHNFTVREIEILTGISKSHVSRQLQEM